VSASTLDTTPHPPAWGVASNAEPSNAEPPNAVTISPYRRRSAAGHALHRAMRPDYPAWLDHVRAAAGCTRPIRLVGHLYTIDAGTGRLLQHTPTDRFPDATIYKVCGNRRGAVCPSCSHTYQQDAYQLLRAGLAGGKGVPDTVARHPAVFATLTAPSFGTVHSRHIRRHTCPDRRRCGCRPQPCHPRRADHRSAGLCRHGRPAVCWARHQAGDRLVGQPLCGDCYDHDHHVVWNLYAGELWRRTKQAVERHLATIARHRGIPSPTHAGEDGMPRRIGPVRVAHGKAAEFQTRGAVHFHTLLRLDGVDPHHPRAVVPPPAGLTIDDLEEAVRAAVRVGFTTPPHPDRPDGWRITWGVQVDVRPITLTGRGGMTDGMVAGYLAKYATKSTEATGHTSTRLNPDTVGAYADPDGDHAARLIDACWRLGRPHHNSTPLTGRPIRHPEPGDRLQPFDTPWNCPDCGTHTRYAACPVCVARRQHRLDSQPSKAIRPTGYARLRRWAHMLGFGGHFLTKARRYSITFGQIRDNRIAHRRNDDHAGQPAGVARHLDQHGDETVLIIGALTFAGAGWHTTGDALLANTSADLARSRQAIGREEIAHELGTTSTLDAPQAA
jgi:hypothetical protein